MNFSDKSSILNTLPGAGCSFRVGSLWAATRKVKDLHPTWRGYSLTASHNPS